MKKIMTAVSGVIAGAILAVLVPWSSGSGHAPADAAIRAPSAVFNPVDAPQPLHRPYIPAPPVQALQKAELETIAVPPGGSLSTVAAKVYGTDKDWPLAWWNNRSKISNPDVVPAGMVLRVGGAGVASVMTPAIERAALAALPQPSSQVPATASAGGGTSPPVSPPAPAPQPPAPQPAGSLQQYAQQLWGSQYGCGAAVVNVESGWDIHATNPRSGAYGIPQALPGSKMASAGADWHDNGFTQLRWMTGYMNGTYGGPCGAWAHEQADGWY